MVYAKSAPWHRVAMMALATLTAATAVPGSDLAREQRLRVQIQDAALVGQAITLRTGETSFLAIHTPSRTQVTRGAVILLHGRGANPDWADVIRPLRTALPVYGWETLSLQMPLAAADADDRACRKLIPESFPRLDFAVEFLAQQGAQHIVVLGHGLGALMAAQWLGREEPVRVQALVVVGLAAEQRGPDSETMAVLKRLSLPILDVYGSRDLNPVLDSAQDRLAAAREAGNRDYRQLEIEGAGHFFRGQEEALVSRVRAWLARIATQTPRAP